MPDYKIRSLRAREVLDSRGNPTVEVVASTKTHSAYAIVPSGASKGVHEAIELRDGGKRFGGLGVQKAIANVRKISNKLIGTDCRSQEKIDSIMLGLDGTANKAKLGANAILGVSLASARLAAYSSGTPLYKHIGKLSKNKSFKLPVPFCNIINGGRHAGTKLKVQEFMIVPVGAKSFSEAAQMASEVYHSLKQTLEKEFGKSAVNVGDEGGFAPNIDNPQKALVILEHAVDQAGHKGKVKFAIDAAASEFYRSGYYDLGKMYSSPDLLDYWLAIIRDFKIISIEDPFAQEDFSNFASLRAKSKIQVVGDDLLCTNVERIKKAISEKSCTTLLLKVNQIGTLTESIRAARLSFDNKWNVMVSHRSGETEDSFISDLCVGLGCGRIKIGAPARGERTAKYNQLIRLEQEYKLKFSEI